MGKEGGNIWEGRAGWKHCRARKYCPLDQLDDQKSASENFNQYGKSVRQGYKWVYKRYN